MVFFSWSKEESKRYAALTKAFLGTVLGTDKLVWFSETSIESGNCFFDDITLCAQKCDSAILFLTRENLYNPWIQFELGLFYGRSDCRIWPIYFGGELCHSTTAFEHIHMLKAEKKVLLNVVRQIYGAYEQEMGVALSEVLTRFYKYWGSYWQGICQVKDSYSNLGSIEIHDLLLQLNDTCHVWGKEGNIFRVSGGFETYELYKFILNNTRKRLWVFGRKNRKMFDRGNIEFFHRFGRDIPNGFSLRCLFLDPASDSIILGNAQKKKNFLDSLKVCIDDAVDIIEESDFSVDQSMRLYRVIRNDAIIISDNTVYFENVKYSEDLKPMHLTNTGFFVAATDTCVGEYYLDIFKDVWDHAYRLGGSNE